MLFVAKQLWRNAVDEKWPTGLYGWPNQNKWYLLASINMWLSAIQR